MGGGRSAIDGPWETVVAGRLSRMEWCRSRKTIHGVAYGRWPDPYRVAHPSSNWLAHCELAPMRSSLPRTLSWGARSLHELPSRPCKWAGFRISRRCSMRRHGGTQRSRRNSTRWSRRFVRARRWSCLPAGGGRAGRVMAMKWDGEWWRLDRGARAFLGISL